MDKFEKRLNEKVLSVFSGAKEWSDLITVLKDLKSLITKYEKNESINLKNMKEKIALSKRLAQCLNPVLPAGLHKETLEAYDLILGNILKENDNYLGEDLGLYAYGLFPFFQNSSATNKEEFLKIIDGRFLKLHSVELEVCLPGLLVGILPGLEEQNEQITKTIKKIFEEIRKKLNDNIFFGNLWSVVIRNQRLRQSGMKYLSEMIPPFKTFESLDDKQKEEYLSNYYPKLSTLVINTLCAVIEDTDVQTVRLGMDFLTSKLPLSFGNKIIDDDQKTVLLISALNLLIKNEYSTTRRLTQWLLGQSACDDELDFENPEIKYSLNILINAFKVIFKNRDHPKEKILGNLKIIEQLLNQQVGLTDGILKGVSIDLITYIVSYWVTSLNESETAFDDEVITKSKSFFTRDTPFIESLWNGLAEHLKVFTQKNKFDDKNKIDKLINRLKFCLIYINVGSNEYKVKFYIPIISNLLSILTKIDISTREGLKRTRNLIHIELVLAASLQEPPKEKAVSPLLLLSLNSIENIIGDRMKNIVEVVNTKFKIFPESSLEHIISIQRYSELIKSFTENVQEYQKYYIKIINILLTIKDDSQITRNEMKMFKQCTELIIRLQEYAQQKEVPEWLKYLEKIVFLGNNQLSLEASSYLIDLIILNMKNPIYEQIKTSIKSNELDKECIDEKYFNNLMKVTRANPTCAEILMARLWWLLDDQQSQKTVVDLLIKFSKADIDIFINSISNTFAEVDFAKSVSSIQKFSQFWKLTNEFYPDIVFFKNGECIFKMLDFLDHEHPLLRHLSKSWLNQSVGQFNKILDPLLAVLLSKDTSWTIRDNNELVFDKEYDNRRIMDAFRKLKNIIINTTDLAINYFITHKSSPDLIEIDVFGKKIEETFKSFVPRDNYLNLMVNISLRFIQGKLGDSISESFSKENYSVNAASCEFLEFLLSFIEPKSELMKIAKYITDPVLRILNEQIDSKDEVMEVQLLNLLKVLLFNTREEHNKDRELAKKLFNNPYLHGCIIKGIQINYFFVRGHFLSFVESCLPIFSEILSVNEVCNIALQLITTTSEFLIKRVKYTAEGKKETDKFSHFNQMNCNFIYKNYLEEYKEYKTFDENDIIIIVKGLKEILFHFIGIKSPSNPQKENWEEMKKRITKTLKDSVSFGDFITGLFSSGNFEEIEQGEKTYKISFDQQLENLFTAFISAWTNKSDSYEKFDYCLNDNGILAYNQKETSSTAQASQSDNDDYSSNQVKLQIIEIAYNIFIKNPIEFFSRFIALWGKGCVTSTVKQENFGNKIVDMQYKLSMIEMLIFLNIPLNIILLSLRSYLSKQQKHKYVKGKTKNYVCSYGQSVSEAKMCHLIYSYLLLGKFDKTKENDVEIWNEMIALQNYILDNTKVTFTACWLVEILNLMLIKFPINKQSINDTNIKRDLTNLYSSLHKKLMAAAIDSRSESIYESPDCVTLPILPSLYTDIVKEIFPLDNLYLIKYQSLKVPEKESKRNLTLRDTILSQNSSTTTDFGQSKTLGTKSNSNIPDLLSSDPEKIQSGQVNSFYGKYHEFVMNKIQTLSPEKLNYLYSQIAFITIKNNFTNIVTALYSDRPKEMKSVFSTMVDALFNVMKGDITSNNKKFETELSTEFLYQMMLSCPRHTSSSSKQAIMSFFSQENFFITSPKMIRFWREIINNLAQCYNGDIISDLISQMVGGIFGTSDQEKSRTLRRMSFVIYSCPKDTFSSKMNIIKEKVKDLLTQFSDSTILEGEIFLMIRVLFLRFSHDNIMEMIKMLWPIIFSELVTIIENKKKVPSAGLQLEAFKFIELLSLANIEEFSLYQWVFILDTFDTKRLDTSTSTSLMSDLNRLKTKVFEPISMKICDDWKSTPQMLEGSGHEKSNLVIVGNNTGSIGGKKKKCDEEKEKEIQNELTKLVKKFFYSIGDMNNYKVKVNFEQIEDIIENDFLNINEDEPKK